MQRNLIASLFILIFVCAYGQSNGRIEVKGTITSNDNEVESITVFNASSNKGTITNAKGEFTIKVGLNDVIEVSALQFKAVSVTITQEVLDSKLLKIYLAEHVNQLDAVLLSSGLSGNLITDITNAKELPKLELNLGNMNALEYFDDKAFDNKVLNYELDKVMNNNTLYNGIDFVSIFGLIANSVIKSKKKKAKSKNEFTDDKPKDILDVYSHKFISETCNIPKEKVEVFLAFINPRDIKEAWYKPENEMYLLDFLIKESKVFLKPKDEKP